MYILNSNIIEEFAKEVENTAYNQAYSKICEFLNEAITAIKQRNPYINNYEILVANEVFTDSEFFSSTLDLFVVFNAVQIELNQKNKKNSFIANLKYFWQEFKSNFAIFNSRKRKNEKLIKKTEKKALSLKDYNVEMLYNDLTIQLAKLLYNKTNIYIDNSIIKVVGEEEFGVEINIIPVFYINDEQYKMYSFQKKYTTKVIDFKDRFINLDIKNIQTDNVFTKQVRIFNNIYWNNLKQQPNQIFIESLLYDCPNRLFSNDDFETMVKLTNYLKNSTMQNLVSICDENTNLFQEPLNTTSYETAIKFVNSIIIE